MAAISASVKSAMEVAEPPPLLSLFVEVGWIQPGLEGRADSRPLTVRDGVPGRVTTSAFVGDGVSEDALECKSVARGGRARGRVQAVAFPFVAAIAELVERS